VEADCGRIARGERNHHDQPGGNDGCGPRRRRCTSDGPAGRAPD
jgi:hypothetical protein